MGGVVKPSMMRLKLMAENPYKAPEVNCDHEADLSGVTVHTRFPLHITVERLFQVNTSAVSLADRIQRAAMACRFSFTERPDHSFLLHRGSSWHGFYTFDIRKLPTVAIVSIRSPDQIHVVFRCQSVWQFSTAGDARRLLRELTLFQTWCQAHG